LRTSRSSDGDAGSEQGASPTPITLTRVRAAYRSLDPEQRLAGAAALALALSLFLPWWRDPVFGISYVGVRRLTFLEVAIFIVAVSVLALLFGRAERRSFHLPLSDGTLIAAAGAWAAFMVIFRMLDPPSRAIGQQTRDYGMRWGALVALASAVTLAFAGARERRKRHPGEREAVAADADARPTEPLPRS
jgi:hypothetical protein